MFNDNSGLVKTWVSLVKKGTYKKEQVPNISNLQNVVYKVLGFDIDSKSLETA